MYSKSLKTLLSISKAISDLFDDNQLKESQRTSQLKEIIGGNQGQQKQSLDCRKQIQSRWREICVNKQNKGFGENQETQSLDSIKQIQWHGKDICENQQTENFDSSGKKQNREVKSLDCRKEIESWRDICENRQNQSSNSNQEKLNDCNEGKQRDCKRKKQSLNNAKQNHRKRQKRSLNNSKQTLSELKTICKKYKFTCNECYKCFDNLSLLWSHQSLHSHPVCNVCKKKFSTVSRYKVHNMLSCCHNEEKMFNCFLCRSSFVSMYKFVKHMQDNHYIFICRYCSQRFIKECLLEDHVHHHMHKSDSLNQTLMKSKSLIKNHGAFYECTVCLKRCRTLKSISVHFRKHTGEKPYTCEICYKMFYISAHLKEHEELHGLPWLKPKKINSFPCNICHLEFKYKYELDSHGLCHKFKTEEVEIELEEPQKQSKEPDKRKLTEVPTEPVVQIALANRNTAPVSQIAESVRLIGDPTKKNIITAVKLNEPQKLKFICNICHLEFKYKCDRDSHALWHKVKTEEVEIKLKEPQMQSKEPNEQNFAEVDPTEPIVHIALTNPNTAPVSSIAESARSISDPTKTKTIISAVKLQKPQRKLNFPCNICHLEFEYKCELDSHALCHKVKAEEVEIKLENLQMQSKEPNKHKFVVVPTEPVVQIALTNPNTAPTCPIAESARSISDPTKTKNIFFGSFKLQKPQMQSKEPGKYKLAEAVPTEPAPTNPNTAPVCSIAESARSITDPTKTKNIFFGSFKLQKPQRKLNFSCKICNLQFKYKYQLANHAFCHKPKITKPIDSKFDELCNFSTAKQKLTEVAPTKPATQLEKMNIISKKPKLESGNLIIVPPITLITELRKSVVDPVKSKNEVTADKLQEPQTKSEPAKQKFVPIKPAIPQEKLNIDSKILKLESHNLNSASINPIAELAKSIIDPTKSKNTVIELQKQIDHAFSHKDDDGISHSGSLYNENFIASKSEKAQIIQVVSESAKVKPQKQQSKSKRISSKTKLSEVEATLSTKEQTKQLKSKKRKVKQGKLRLKSRRISAKRKLSEVEPAILNMKELTKVGSGKVKVKPLKLQSILKKTSVKQKLSEVELPKHVVQLEKLSTEIKKPELELNKPNTVSINPIANLAKSIINTSNSKKEITGLQHFHTEVVKHEKIVTDMQKSYMESVNLNETEVVIDIRKRSPVILKDFECGVCHMKFNSKFESFQHFLQHKQV